MRALFLSLLIFVIGTASAATWVDKIEADPMGRGNNEISSIESNNSINLSAPYSGEQHATFSLRKMRGSENEFTLSIEQGQFICEIQGCDITIKIDDKKSQLVQVKTPSDGSRDTLIGGLSQSLKHAIASGKKLLIEATIYQNGNIIFDFNIEGSKFKGNKGYLISELNDLIKSKKLPSLKLKSTVPLDASSFKICKEVVSEKEKDAISVIERKSQTELTIVAYLEDRAIKKSCHKNSNKMTIEFYSYE